MTASCLLPSRHTRRSYPQGAPIDVSHQYFNFFFSKVFGGYWINHIYTQTLLTLSNLLFLFWCHHLFHFKRVGGSSPFCTDFMSTWVSLWLQGNGMADATAKCRANILVKHSSNTIPYSDGIHHWQKVLRSFFKSQLMAHTSLADCYKSVWLFISKIPYFHNINLDSGFYKTWNRE